ncbi:MAG TPA: DNA-binding response regulator [Anaerolinea thermolimosa]|uniref:DNA-binding response regulator n=1 Tax=Anaerolinea thermolimosa TaxID=229919 RepID=A0A3D1JCE8_9CHLR|nr:response regulator transcription factor [Anaerolinea thermolimosa]GAP07924.1 response regulators consisting of a CheY-like receiver domain and a winged-helix DNA-binding domain [Anaerolinea thermolimosa]HCE16259.1 DNA-binding response regulator [Anaerolinea thermolimosa]
MNPADILIIEDDEIVARTIERCLRGNEYRVRVTHSGVEGLQAARREPPDLVILDVIMPGMDGYTVCREMRQDTLLAEVPILFLTAKAKDEDKITGLSAGADDYLGKPFNVDELLLRIRAILRRTRQMHADSQAASQVRSAGEEVKTLPLGKEDRILAIGPYTLNTRTYEFSGPKTGKFRLTPVQYDLLYHLMSHPGEIFSPARLLDEVWDYPSDAGSPDLVRVHIKNLRERIEEDPRNPKFIRTVPGYGYTIQPEEES